MITAIGEKLTSFSMSNNKMAGLPFVFKAISVNIFYITLQIKSNSIFPLATF